ncbi:hypothetical protein HED34_03225 [Vagococcus fluvialis]|uniref:hypothetical protein n=1 Tax=Vagococcus fluvialis TaxID=2738 RepID=UPI001432A6F4|nr:hypothetical protein [Vagococcus fluvialis]NKC58972.1 hypothetical protein [Vagococcus fluvialis]NKD49727.1 hypothetical protein [Vagococcus fluvialis]
MFKLTAGDLLNKVHDGYCDLQESVNNQFLILHSVTDEGNLVLDEEENVLASTPSEKLEIVINNLIELKEEALTLESIEKFIDDGQ